MTLPSLLLTVQFENSNDCKKNYGFGRWRKLKGTAVIQLEDGTVCQAEIHWYEAHGIGRKEFKIKYILE